MKRFFAGMACAIIFCSIPDGMKQMVWADEKNSRGEYQELTALFPGMPEFNSTSRDPLLLRYRFRTGDRINCNYRISVKNSMQYKGRNISREIDIALTGIFTVSSVDDNGDSSAVLTVTRIMFNVPGPNPLTFDSNQELLPEDTALIELKSLLNVPVPVRVSQSGMIFDIDYVEFDKAIEKAGSLASYVDSKKIIGEMARSTFIPLPGKEVGTGDEYDAGSIVQEMKGICEMAAVMKYRVIAVSGDRKLALLRPLGVITASKLHDKAVNVIINEGTLSGWILFDVAKGAILRSEGISVLDMSVFQGDDMFRNKMEILMKYRSI